MRIERDHSSHRLAVRSAEMLVLARGDRPLLEEAVARRVESGESRGIVVAADSSDDPYAAAHRPAA